MEYKDISLPVHIVDKINNLINSKYRPTTVIDIEIVDGTFKEEDKLLQERYSFENSKESLDSLNDALLNMSELCNECTRLYQEARRSPKKYYKFIDYLKYFNSANQPYTVYTHKCTCISKFTVPMHLRQLFLAD